MLTPPLGICLIVSSSISHDRLTSICRQIVPFLLVLLVDLAIITFCPPLTMLLAGLIHYQGPAGPPEKGIFPLTFHYD